MIVTLLVLDVVFLITAFGVRTAIHLRRTSDAGWRLGRPHSVGEGIARAAMFGSGALVGVGLAVGSDGGAPIVGVVTCVAAIVWVFVAQLQMGSSRRIGVDPSERTELVTSGLYQWVRNPIYLGMAVFVIGQTAAHPNAPNLLAAIAMVIGVQSKSAPSRSRTSGASTGRCSPTGPAGRAGSSPASGRSPAAPARRP